MKILLSIILCVVGLALLGQPARAFDLFGQPCITETDGSKVCGPCATNPNTPSCVQASQQGSDTTNRITGTGNIINIAANILAIITGAGAVIMILIGGFTLVTSGGNAESLANARRRIIYSIIGLIIVALAWTITRFMTDKLIQ